MNIEETKKQTIYLIGSSGHAAVILDIIASCPELGIVVGVFDDYELVGSFKLGLPVLGTVARAMDFADRGSFIISIGDNAVRMEIAAKMQGALFISAIHKSAIIGSNVHIGEGTVVMPGAVININSSVGCHSIINTGAIVEHDCLIRDFVHISPGVTLCGAVQIHKMSWIGAGSTVIPKIKICSDVIVGAGATVIRDIDEKGVYVGCPAKKLNDK